MVDHHPLGQAGGAGGEDDVGEVLRPLDRRQRLQGRPAKPESSTTITSPRRRTIRGAPAKRGWVRATRDLAVLQQVAEALGRQARRRSAGRRRRPRRMASAATTCSQPFSMTTPTSWFGRTPRRAQAVGQRSARRGRARRRSARSADVDHGGRVRARRAAWARKGSCRSPAGTGAAVALTRRAGASWLGREQAARRLAPGLLRRRPGARAGRW